MKRFLVFNFEQYYPAGGIDDLTLQTDDLFEAILRCVRAEDDYECRSQYNYIYDGETNEVIFTYEWDTWESPEEKLERERAYYAQLRAAGGRPITTSSVSYEEYSTINPEVWGWVKLRLADD